MQYQRPALVQGQHLKMNPQLFQSIQLMAMPIQELKLRIDEELQANPALEVVEDNSTVSIDESESNDTTAEYDFFEDSSDPGYTSSSYDDEASENKRRFMEGALSTPESLHDHLLWQLRLQPISDDEFRVGEALILNLDDNGFHREPLESLFNAADERVVARMIAMIQSFEPLGTCVADYRESLLVQARADLSRPECTDAIIEHHLELLDRGKHEEIAKKLKADVDDVEEAREFIRTLTPFPGRLFSSDQTTYVVPDLMVVMRDGQFVIILNDDEIPVLAVSQDFTGVGADAAEKDVKRFVRRRVKDASWFIQSIRQRNDTLVKTARAILEFQRDFFLKGSKYLVPLTLKDIASEVGVHEATISRISNGKYIQTEWGIFEIKYFFTNSISGAGSSGSRFSKEGVKQIIKELLEEQSGARALSDQGIADLLATRGIKLARRTVAKYRKELDISSSYRR
ncbi:MAG: RNA polymerase sigma-54 factor [Spirochaetaceae bacterium]|nr:MAG: RNA polymerase sigma-54 factor [Spirochaetaceae bacterium]